MIIEAIEKIINRISTAKREPTLIIEDKIYVYNDSEMCYEQKEEFEAFSRQICNVDSLVKVVLETARRLEKSTGNQMTVIFDNNGATLFPEDTKRDKQDKWYFRREESLLLETINFLVGREHSHKNLISQLEKIKSNVIDFEDLYQKLSKLKVSKQVNFSSNPIYQEGENGESYSWSQTVDANGVPETASCPAKISFQGSLVRGTEITYAFDVSLIPVLEEDKGKINFQIEMPGYQMVMDQVREDDFKKFCDGVKNLSDLLILRNY